MQDRKHLPVVCWIASLRAERLDYGIEVIEEASSPTEVEQFEIYWIEQWKAMGARLLNLTDGGDGTSGYRQSPEHVEKRVSQIRGKPRPDRMVSPSEETRRKISESLKRGMTDEKRAFFREHLLRVRPVDCGGREPGSVSGAEKQKLRERMTGNTYGKLNKGRRKTEEHKRNLSIAKRGKTGNPIKDQYGREYRSASEAARILGLKSTHICRVLKGKRNCTGGYSFTYASRNE